MLLCHRTFHWPTLGPVFDHLYDSKFFSPIMRPKDFCKDVCEDGVPSYYVQKTSMLYRYNICDREEPTCKISYNMDITSCICQKVMIHQSSITFSQRSFTCINCVRHNKNYSTTYSPFCYLYLPPFDANNKHLCSHVGKVYIQQTYVFLHRESYSNSSHKRRINDLEPYTKHIEFFRMKNSVKVLKIKHWPLINNTSERLMVQT